MRLRHWYGWVALSATLMLVSILAVSVLGSGRASSTLASVMSLVGEGPRQSGSVPTTTPTLALVDMYVVVVAPEADAKVSQDSPVSNHGRSASLKVDGGRGHRVESYLRFSVAGLTGPVAQATLRLHAATRTTRGAAVYSTGNDWEERRITWENRPKRTSPAVDRKGTIKANAWVEFDVTALVTDGGTYSFILATDKDDGVKFSSREADLAPQLVLVVAGAAPTTPASSAPAGAYSPSGVLAFPGAEGFGAVSVGGRGGRVIEVTNLNDSGPGSLRAALEASGPRIVVFRVGGTITVLDRIRITNPYVTIAGQTSPGGGITIKNDPGNTRSPLEIYTHDVIVRYIRLRPGPSDASASSLNALVIGYDAYNVVVDHVSASWGTDGIMLSYYDAHDVTIQWSILSESLQNSTHSEGAHSKGLHIADSDDGRQSYNFSVHHNLLAHNYDRNLEANTTGVVDFVNNVIYNWGGKASYTEDEHSKVPFNLVNNYYERGPSTSSSSYEMRLLSQNGSYTDPVNGGSWFIQGNIGPHRPDASYPEEAVVRPEDRRYIVPERFPAPAVTTTDAFTAHADVLARAGATFPLRDSVDLRVISEVSHGTGRIIDHPSEVGGWPVLAAGVSPVDSDHDGMPDEWEVTRGLNPQMDDSAGDRDGDGYTNVEEYVNGLVSQTQQQR